LNYNELRGLNSVWKGDYALKIFEENEEMKEYVAKRVDEA